MSLDRPQPAGSSNPSPTSSADLQATQLQKEIAELQRRERSLRLRNHELAESLERYTKSFQAKNDQQQIYEADLKRAHDSLVTAYNKLKRRFQLQQKLHEEEIASLRKEIVRVQSGVRKHFSRRFPIENFAPLRILLLRRRTNFDILNFRKRKRSSRRAFLDFYIVLLYAFYLENFSPY